MNKIFAILLFVGLSSLAMAQVPCYSINMQVAQVEFEQQQYAKALQHFEKAKTCAGDDTVAVSEWIAKCRQMLRMMETEAPVAVELEVAADSTAAVEEDYVHADEEAVEEVAEEVVEQVEEVAEPVVAEPVKEEVVEDFSKTAYMHINKIEFANYKNGNYLSDYGALLYASDMRYLVFKLYYDGLDKQSRHNIDFQVKLIDAQGKLVTGRGAPEGYSAGYEMTVMTSKGKNEEFPCRGRGDTSIYRPGDYKFELWYRDNLIYTEPLTFLPKPGEPTFLNVNGETQELRHAVNAGGERVIYTVGTDGAKYNVEGINERWVTVEYLPNNQFAVTYKTDYAEELTPYQLYVTSDYMSVTIVAEYSREGNLLYSRAWEEPLTRSVDVYDQRSEMEVLYKGQLTKREKMEGHGINMWPNGAFYYGSFVNNHREGKGLYFIPKQQQMQHGTYYVGEFGNTGLRNGQGRLYDVYGNLIYDGAFFADRPQGTISMEACDPSIKFVCVHNADGSYYIGETRNGVRHGQGIYVYPNGDLWCGQWNDGVGGDGFMSYRKLNGVTDTPFKN